MPAPYFINLLFINYSKTYKINIIMLLFNPYNIPVILVVGGLYHQVFY